MCSSVIITNENELDKSEGITLQSFNNSEAYEENNYEFQQENHNLTLQLEEAKEELQKYKDDNL